MTFKKYIELRTQAFELVYEKSKGEMRYYSPIEKQPYWTHLMNVHNFLIIRGETDHEILLAAILHDVIEDSDITVEYLTKHFSIRISEHVQIVSKPDNFDPEIFYKKILNNWDVAPMKIKVADRIDNMLTNYCYSDKATNTEKYLIETKKYFVPMAKKLGWEESLQNALLYYQKHLIA